MTMKNDIIMSNDRYNRVLEAAALSASAGLVPFGYEDAVLAYYSGVVMDEPLCRHMEDIVDVSFQCGFWGVSPHMSPKPEGDILLPTGERINAETVKNALSVLRASDEPEDSPGMRL